MLIDGSELAFLSILTLKVNLTYLHEMLIDGSEFAFLPTDLHAIITEDIEFAFLPCNVN